MTAQIIKSCGVTARAKEAEEVRRSSTITRCGNVKRWRGWLSTALPRVIAMSQGNQVDPTFPFSPALLSMPAGRKREKGESEHEQSSRIEVPTILTRRKCISCRRRAGYCCKRQGALLTPASAQAEDARQGPARNPIKRQWLLSLQESATSRQP